MRTVAYSKIERRVAQLLGWDPSNLDSDDWANIRDSISDSLEEIWRFAHWADLQVTERRRYANPYDSGTTYAAGDFVYHIGSDDYYQALQSTTGNAPATQSGGTWTLDSANWAYARNSYDAGEYDATVTYAAGDQVKYSETGEVYQAIQGTTGNLPTDATYWGQLVIFEATIPFVQAGFLAIGDPILLHESNPKIDFGSPEVPFDTTSEGIQPRTWNAVTQPWLTYMRRPHRFTGDVWDATVAYTAVSDEDASTSTPATSSISGTGVTIGYPGASALRAVTGYVTNQMAYLLYISTEGDGGEGNFRFNPDETAADDGVDVLQPTNLTVGPGRWVRTS